MMTYRLGQSDSLHISGDVPMSGETLVSQGHPVEVIQLGRGEVQFNLFFGESLGEQIANLDRMIEVLAAARGRAHALRVEAAIVSHEESHSPDCGCLDAVKLLDTPMGLEDDLAGADQ
jgi:hypothetical protein